jgi:hypothetical protein
MPFVELVLEDSRDTEKLARLSYAILGLGLGPQERLGAVLPPRSQRGS